MRNKRNPGWLGIFLTIALVSSLVLAGCSNTPGNSSGATAEKNNKITQANNQEISQLPKLEGKATVIMTVKGKPITIEVDGDNAPITAGNFVDLVSRGVYDGLAFHRVVKDPQPFVAQGGDPQGKDPSFPENRLGTGGFVDPETKRPRYIPLEIKPEGAEEPIYSKTLKKAGVSKPPVLRHTPGAVAMARSQMPDSASAQFYFALSELSFLDGDYAVFGYVTQGMDIVDGIEQGDRIDSVKVEKGLENLEKS